MATQLVLALEVMTVDVVFTVRFWASEACGLGAVSAYSVPFQVGPALDLDIATDFMAAV